MTPLAIHGEKPDDSVRDKSYVLTSKLIETDYSYKHTYVMSNVFVFTFLHVLGLWGLGILLTGGISFKGFLWGFILAFNFGLGITVGAHRYYAHKTFKANPLLRAYLIMLQTGAGQNSMYTWVRDHRVHHRYSETDADPHNAKRGFFFSHIGWLMARRHPYVSKYGKNLDMSDLEADWMVTFQKKYFLWIYIVIAVMIPVAVPVLFWKDSFINSVLVCYFFRYIATLNNTWLINSAAHLYGTRPYDKNMGPVESYFAAFATYGEGWHNYHHTFPWDYNAAELPMPFNVSGSFIRFCEKIGLAYDLKTVSSEMVRKRIMRTGDGTHFELGNDEARSAVTAVGPLHPFNPTYNVKYEIHDNL